MRKSTNEITQLQRKSTQKVKRLYTDKEVQEEVLIQAIHGTIWKNEKCKS